MILADKIIALRKRCGWSQEELAGQLGISRQSVSKWESGTSIPDLDKIIKMSDIFQVSTDYLLKDEIEEADQIDVVDSDGEADIRSISLEEANAFMDTIRKVAGKNAIAVLLCVLSPVCLLLLNSFSEIHMIAETLANGIGIGVVLMLVTIAVAIFIPNGMELSKYEYLEKEKVSLQYGVKGIVGKKKEAYEPVYRRDIVIGTMLCILGTIPVVVTGSLEMSDFVVSLCIPLLLVFVAIATVLFVKSGMIYSSFQKLLQEGDYTTEKKEINHRTAAITAIYWCTVTAVYLGISFYTMAWGKTWIIWAVAGVLYAVLYSVMQAVYSKQE